MGFEVTPLPDLDLPPAEMRQVAALLFAALPDFYAAIPGDHGAVCDLIADQCATDRTEVCAPLIARQDGTIVGAAAVYPVAEFAERQQESMMHIMRRLERPDQKTFRKALKSNQSTTAALDGLSGQYIARITIADTVRGTGLGGQLLSSIAARSPAEDLILHVDQANTGAIGFYQKQGFTFVGDPDVSKVAMRRPAA